MRPKFFNKSRYSSIAEALTTIKKEFSALWDKVNEDNDDASDVGSLPQQDVVYTSDGTSSSDYNGLFTILLDSRNRIIVTEGISHGVLSDPMLVYVNGSKFKVPRFTSTYTHKIGDRIYVAIVFNGPLSADGTEKKATVEIKLYRDDVPNNTQYKVIYILGMIDSSGNIHQYHVTGIPSIDWCYRFGG